MFTKTSTVFTSVPTALETHATKPMPQASKRRGSPVKEVVKAKKRTTKSTVIKTKRYRKKKHIKHAHENKKQKNDKYEKNFYARDIGDPKDLSGEDYSTIVMSLNNACKVKDYPMIKELIEGDVGMVSKVMHTYTLYLNFFFRSKLDDELATEIFSVETLTYFRDLKTTSFRQFLFQLQGKTGKRHATTLNSHFLEFLIESDIATKVNTVHKSYVFQEAIKHFETMFRNTINENTSNRIIMYLKNIPLEGKNDALSHKDAKKLADKILGNDTDAPLFLNTSLKSFEKEKQPFRLIPLLYLMQKHLTRAGKKSFSVVPQYKPIMRSITITNTVLSELMSRYYKAIDRPLNTEEFKAFPGNARAVWNKYFNVLKYEKFNEDGSPKKVFWQLVTNGVQASLVFKNVNREEKKPKQITKSTLDHKMPLGKKITQKLPVPVYDFVAGIDPGARLSIGGIRYNRKTGQRKLVKMRSNHLHALSGKNVREMKRLKYSGVLDNEIRAKNEALGNLGASHADYYAYTRFQLSFMNRRFELQKKKVLRRLKFDSYIRRRSTIDKMVSGMCERKKKTLIFYGDGTMAPFIRG